MKPTRRGFLGAVLGLGAAGALVRVAGLGSSEPASTLPLGATVQDTSTFQVLFSADTLAKHPALLSRLRQRLEETGPKVLVTSSTTVDGRATRVTAKYVYEVPEHLREEMRSALASLMFRCAAGIMAEPSA